MKKHFVTGGTGFIGRYLIKALVTRGDKVFILVRNREKALRIFSNLKGRYSSRLELVNGDIRQKRLGLDSQILERFKSIGIDVTWHSAADLSMNLSADDFYDRKRYKSNVVGTKNVVNLANYLGSKLCFFSTIHVRGNAESFTEADFDLGQTFRNNYEKTKFLAEKVVRGESEVPYVIFRPGNVIGNAPLEKASECAMGYYRFIFLFYFLKNWILKNLRCAKFSGKVLTFLGTRVDGEVLKVPFLIIPYAKGIRQNLVSVDYVVRTLVKIGMSPFSNGKTFHLTNPRPTEIEFFLKSVFSDLSIVDVKFLALNPRIFKLLFTLVHTIAVPWRGYIKSAQIYVSYLTHDDKFRRRNVNYFNKPPQKISRKLLMRVNRYAFRRVFPEILH